MKKSRAPKTMPRRTTSTLGGPTVATVFALVGAIVSILFVDAANAASVLERPGADSMPGDGTPGASGYWRDMALLLVGLVGGGGIVFSFNCVTRAATRTSTTSNEEVVVDFDTVAPLSGFQPTVISSTLTAAYTVLGQTLTRVNNLKNEVIATKDTLKVYEDAEEFARKQAYIDHFKTSVLAPAEAKLAKEEEKLDTTQKLVFKLQEEAGDGAAPLAKKSTKAYSETYAAAVAVEPEDASAYATEVDSAAATLPPAVKDGVKTTVQQPVEGGGEEGSAFAGTKYAPSIINGYRRLGVLCAFAFYTEVRTEILKDNTITQQDLEGSKVAKVMKGVERLMEKAFGRHGGDAALITDYGRLTFTAATLRILLAIFKVLVSICSSAGDGGKYTIVRIKNLLDVAIPDTEVAINSGYRNTNILVRDNDEGHVFEVQLNLASLEEVKDGPLGHAVFEVLRKLGYNAANSVAVGGMTQLALRAIESGRIMELSFAGVSWTKESAALLQQALASPGCRVIKAVLNSGQGETAAMAQAVAAGLIAAGAGCSVKEIVLAINNLGEAEGAAIAKAMEVNTSVTDINVYNNGIPAETVSAINAAAERNAQSAKEQ